MKLLIIFFVTTVTIYVNLTSVLAQEDDKVTEILDIKPEVRIIHLLFNFSSMSNLYLIHNAITYKRFK